MENVLQPKLRFSRFTNELINCFLKDIAKFSKGKNISKADIDVDGIYECIRYGELYTKYSEVIDVVYSRTNLEKSSLVFSEENDVIIPASGESTVDIATASCVIRGGIALGGDLNIIKTKVNGVFLSYYFNNRRKYDIAKKAQGISVVHIYSEHLKTLSLNLPSLQEQQKIADYLSTIDRKISLLEEKKVELTRYKKMMMQKLFSQEIRFKDENGRGFENWNNSELGALAEIVSGGTPDTTIEEYWNDEINWFTPTEINSKYLYSSRRKISTIGQKKSSAKLLKIGAVLFTSRATIGECAIITTPSATNQGIQSFEVFESSNNEFLYYWLLTHKGLFLKLCSGSTFLEISKRQLAKIQICVPSLPEQQKIANFLSNIDEKINKVEEQIQQTKLFKKAMLQQMFV